MCVIYRSEWRLRIFWNYNNNDVYVTKKLRFKFYFQYFVSIQRSYLQFFSFWNLPFSHFYEVHTICCGLSVSKCFVQTLKLSRILIAIQQRNIKIKIKLNRCFLVNRNCRYKIGKRWIWFMDFVVSACEY